MRFTDQAPAYCSSCFQQKPQERHIDFEAYWDGPVIDGSVKVAIDDLVLCAKCVEDAAKLLGYTAGAEDKLEAKAEEIKALKAKLDQAELHARKLREAFDTRPAGAKKPARATA